MKFFFIAGEDSGDALAANLITTLKNRFGDKISCMGVGGPLMQKAGFEELLSLEEISVVGIWEVIPKIPQILKIQRALIEEIEQSQPDILVTVDFPDFNFHLAKTLKKRGKFKGKVVHYVAPSVWAWREGRAKKISAFVDGIMCLFPMEVDYFTKHGMKAAYVGHPIVENFRTPPDELNFRKIHNISNDTVIIGLFFGSRESELKNMHGVLIESGKYMKDILKNVYFIAPTLPKNEFTVQSFISELESPSFISADLNFKWAAFQSCDVAIAVSGTVGLELAYAGVPHVITYKLNPITYMILKLMVKVKFAHLVNILLNKSVVPEFIQGNCIPEKIADEVISFVKNKEKREDMKVSFAEFRKILGDHGDKKPSERAADFLLAMIEK